MKGGVAQVLTSKRAEARSERPIWQCLEEKETGRFSYRGHDQRKLWLRTEARRQLLLGLSLPQEFLGSRELKCYPCGFWVQGLCGHCRKTGTENTQHI